MDIQNTLFSSEYRTIKGYTEAKGVTYEIFVSYNKDRAAYTMSVCPVEIVQHEGYTVNRTTPSEGVRIIYDHTATRYNAKRLQAIMTEANENGTIEKMILLCQKKNEKSLASFA